MCREDFEAIEVMYQLSAEDEFFGGDIPDVEPEIDEVPELEF